MKELASQSTGKKRPVESEECTQALASSSLCERFPMNASAWINCIKINKKFKRAIQCIHLPTPRQGTQSPAEEQFCVKLGSHS